jgi:hypothetical protein
MRKSVYLILGASLLSQAGFGQHSVPDTSLTHAAYHNAISFYHQFTDKSSRLYNGILHMGYPNKIEGFAYFPDNTFHTGSVVYDGIHYSNVQMKYDAYQDELVILHFSRLTMSLHSEKVKEFTFSGRRFVRLVPDSVKYSWLLTGFYEELHKGPTITLLARRKKFIEEKVTDQLEQRFLLSEFYFIQRDDTWYVVQGYKSLLKILHEHATAIRQYLKQNKIRFRKNREAAITMAVQHFEALKQ